MIIELTMCRKRHALGIKSEMESSEIKPKKLRKSASRQVRIMCELVTHLDHFALQQEIGVSPSL